MLMICQLHTFASYSKFTLEFEPYFMANLLQYTYHFLVKGAILPLVI